MKRKEKATYSSRQKLSETSPEYKFGTRLKKEMKKKGMSQSDLAQMMNVSESAVKDWCQHYTFPNEMNLGELCRIFAPCSMDYFHGNIDEPNYDMQFVMKYTGLSETAVQFLHDLLPQQRKILSMPIERSHYKQEYREMFGEEPPMDYYDILNSLLNGESGLIKILQLISRANRMRIEYDEYSKVKFTEDSFERERASLNRQALRELRFEKDKQAAVDHFKDFIEHLLPSINWN